ncbi:MAG: hypothetical protein KF810_17990 [Rhizobiaceae bacterium]|nr:hypothetical protein [Rhizobiaceae bacterium]
MKALFSATFVVLLAVPMGVPSVAQPRYDRKLEEAVMAIVASKVGDIRGGFGLDARPGMVVVQDYFVSAATEAQSVAVPKGMSRAVEGAAISTSMR